MKMTHIDAIAIEAIVRNAFHCDRYGVGGYADADILERNPMDAVALCVGKLYRDKHDDEIAEFARKWRNAFQHPEDNEDCTIDDFIKEFNGLISLLKT